MSWKRPSCKGQSIWLFALGVVAFFGFLAIVLDFGRMFLVKQRLRNHCDAAALAGALNLPEDPVGAVDKAAEYYATNVHSPAAPQFIGHGDTTDTSIFEIVPKLMTNWRNKTLADEVHITTPYDVGQIRYGPELSQATVLGPEYVIEVYGERQIFHYLGQLMGKPYVRLRARAVAYVICGGKGHEGGDDDDDGLCVEDELVPIGYPERQPPGWYPPQGMPVFVPPTAWVIGQRYQITHPGTGVQGNNYFLAIGGRGGQTLEKNLKYGAQGTHCLGNVVETEPGVKNGPVDDGINYRYDKCPGATWDDYPAGCPRPIVIAIIDPYIDDYNGRSDVKIVRFARFFVDEYDKNRHPDAEPKIVYGWFMGFVEGNPPAGDDDDDDTVGNDCITVTFSSDCLCADVKSVCHDLSNVVLKLEDGTHQKFDGLSGSTGTFCGVGSEEGKRIVGIWVKAGHNASGDCPGCGEYFANPRYPEGCGADDGGDDDGGGGGGGGDCGTKEVALIK